MYSEKDLVTRSSKDMAQEVKDLTAESKRLREEYEAALQREGEQRLKSVEARPEDVEMAELLWQEAERLKEEGRELLRLSMEKKLRAAEVQHRIDVRAQIESLDDYEGIWRKAAKAARD
jgi:3-deoxy-D-arabino-heptulosonate 7-phosphate (DAHP) synthase